MSTLIVHQGAFGARVALLLGGHARGVPLATFLEQPEPHARTADGSVLVACSTPAHDLFGRLDDIFRSMHASWLLCFVSERHLFCGPAFGGAPAPCFRCFRRRYLAHCGSLSVAEQDMTMSRYFSGDLGRELPGYLPTSARMAASYLLHVRDAADPGVVIKVDLFDTTVTVGRVIPVHGCDRCRPTQNDGSRFNRFLSVMFAQGPPNGR